MYNKYLEGSKLTLKLEEFIDIKNYGKFDINNITCKFSDGTYMGKWFSNNFCEIMSGKEQLFKEIQIQYKLFIKNKDEKYKNRLKEFLNETNVEKFKRKGSRIKFSDGVFMSPWFYNNFYDIKNSYDDLSKSIILQYDKYESDKKEQMEELKKKTAYEKKKEFLEEKNNQKFKLYSNVKFKSGNYMGIWFNRYKKELKSSDDELSKLILEQYERFIENQKKCAEKTDNDKLNEFSKEKDLRKFSHGCKIKFSDGTYMGDWFILNKENIMNANDAVSKIICLQYEKFNLQKKYPEQKKIKKIKEFAEENDLKKFNTHSELKFKDGTHMGNWFNGHRKELLRMDDDLIGTIFKQYEAYKETMIEEINESRIRIFNQKLEEFSLESNLNKFKYCSNVKFSDGSYMVNWFIYNKERILNSNDELSLKIQEEYYSYKSLKEEVKKFYSDDSLNNKKKI